jgi:redox-sensitive bicupin YhaK (pirin superfamily)
MLPETNGLTPSYEQREFSETERRGKLKLVAAKDPKDGALAIHQNAQVYSALLTPGEKASYSLAPGRHAWVQVARGAIAVNGQSMEAGDGAPVSQEALLELVAQKPSDILLFDLA